MQLSSSWWFEKYESKWESSPNRGENNKYLKPPPRSLFQALDPSKLPATLWQESSCRDPLQNLGNAGPTNEKLSQESPANGLNPLKIEVLSLPPFFWGGETVGRDMNSES